MDCWYSYFSGVPTRLAGELLHALFHQPGAFELGEWFWLNVFDIAIFALRADLNSIAGCAIWLYLDSIQFSLRGILLLLHAGDEGPIT